MRFLVPASNQAEGIPPPGSAQSSFQFPAGGAQGSFNAFATPGVNGFQSPSFGAYGGIPATSAYHSQQNQVVRFDRILFCRPHWICLLDPEG